MRNWNKEQVKSTLAIDPSLYLPENAALHSVLTQTLLDVVCIDLHHRWKCGIQNFCPPLKWLNQPHTATAEITLLMMKPSFPSPNSLPRFIDPFPASQKNEPAFGSHQCYHPSPTSGHIVLPGTLPAPCWTFSKKPRPLTQHKILQLLACWVVCGWLNNCSWESSPAR